MPPKKMKKPKKKVKPTNTNINKQTVIINQPVKRKYTRRKKTQRQPISQFSTPESTIGQVFNLLRFIPQQQSPNYKSIQDTPKSPYIPMLDNRQHNYEEDDDKMSSVSGSTRDFSDFTSVSRFKPDKITSHKPDILTPVQEKAEKAERDASSSSSSEEEDVKSDTSSGSDTSVKSVIGGGGGGGGGGVFPKKTDEPSSLKSRELRRTELEYREKKNKLDNYKGNNPNTLKTYESQLNSARFSYNYQRNLLGLERITDKYD